MIRMFDPIKNRDDFISAINSIYKWTRYIKPESYTKKIGEKKNIDNDNSKIDFCQLEIDRYISEWDACKNEGERKTLVCSIQRPSI